MLTLLKTKRGLPPIDADRMSLSTGPALAILLLLLSLGACRQTVPDAPAETPLPQPSPSPARPDAPSVPRINLQYLDYLTASPPTALAATASHLYLGAGRQLVVVDVTNPNQPQRRGDVVLPGPITLLAAVGHHVYAATQNGPGLYVVDAGNPAAPTIVNTYFPGRIDALALAGSTLYVGAGNLRVVDVSDPANPLELTAFDPSGQPGRQVRNVVVTADRAYLHLAGGSATEEIAVIGVDEPTQPALLGLVALDEPAADQLAIGERLYLLSEQSDQLQIVDVADPANLRLAPAGGDWQGNVLIAADSLLFLAVNGRLQILDPTVAGTPGLLAQFTDLVEPARLLAVHGDRLYAAGAATLSIVDIGQPSQPGLAGVYEQQRLASPAQKVASSGDPAYIVAVAGAAGLQVVEVADETNGSLTPLATLDTAGHAWDVVVQDGLAFVADEHNGLRVVDLSDPQRPHEIGAYDPPGPYEFFHDLVLVDDLLYVADGSLEQSGLRLVNVADPTNPAEVGFWPLAAAGHGGLPARVEAVAVSGALAYVAAGTAGLRVVDVSEPTQPVEIGAYETPGRAADLVTAGQTVYLMDGDLRVVDVSVPNEPSLIGFQDLGNTGATPYLAWQPPWLFVAGTSQHILDVSDPSQPVERTTASFVDGRPTIMGQRLFVTGQGLFAFRLETPES